MRPPSAVSPRRSARGFCTLGNSTFSHFSTAPPVNSIIVSLADPCSRSFKVTSYLCMDLASRLAGLHPAAQHLRHAPGLRDTAARRVRSLGVEDLTDRPDALLIEMWNE